MGKSPGKWIRAILFGKKSKSSLSKGVPIERKATPEPPAADLGLSHSVISDATHQNIDRGEKAESEKGLSGAVPHETAPFLPAKQGVNLQDTAGLSSVNDEERARQEEAATKAQAAFRGYLARRAFRALKGIIRLQALIRGHLVRRQAVATLRCMQSIVRLQALARGQRVGFLGVETSLLLGKLAKMHLLLLSSVPTAMPLSLQYDAAEPNSAWVWLERWSLIRFWEPVVQPKNIVDVKYQGKQASAQIREAETGKSRRTFRKVAATATGDNTAVDVEKPRRSIRKLVNHQMESQEQPQNELERVKRNLRKVSASTTIVSEKSEIELEKPQQNIRKPSNVSADDVTEPANVNVSEKPSDSPVVVEESAEMEIPLKPLTVEELVNLPPADHHAIEQHSLAKDTKVDISTTVQEEESSKEDQTGKENQRTRRRKSLPVKQEFHENVSQNAASLPSYMAATESAKAKLRMQGGAKFSDEGVENVFVRRHSLPSSTNGKLNLSPRIQKPAKANGKGGSKSNKSLSSSKDERVLQPGWRR